MNSMNPQDQEIKTLRWFEISASLACWIGIAGLIILIVRGAWAAQSDTLPAGHPYNNPFANSKAPPSESGLSHTPKGNFFDDDDDDDDFPSYDAGAGPSSNHYPPSHFSNHEDPSYNPTQYNSSQHNGSHSLSAGGSAATDAPPITKTDKGIIVGGSPANGVISKNDTSPARIDTESAEGSKEIVTDFNFPDADILDIAKTMGKLTGKNFIFDKDVKGRGTIISNSPVTVGEAWKAFLTLLDINGYALIPSGNFLRIARQRDARDKQLRTYTGDFSPDTDALITRIFSLKYINAEDISQKLRNFVPTTARVIAYDQTNSLFVTDTGSNIAKLAKMLEVLDVEGYDAGIEVIPVKIASAADLSKLIGDLLPGTGGSSGGAGGMPRFGASKFSARRTKEGGVINNILADERTNTLIVNANPKGVEQVRELVSKLDQKAASTGGGKVHVVYLQFADAEQLATTLNSLTQGGSSGRTSNMGGPGGGMGMGTGINPTVSTLFEGSIKVSPDKSTNSLVVTASPSDFATVQRVINRLDIPRDQVYVQVIIMEIMLQRNFNFSANLVSMPSMIGSITDGAALQNVVTGNFANSNGAIIGIPLGAPTTLTLNNQSYTVSSVLGLIKVLQQNTNSNILATPQILAMDNVEATFETAEKIPVATSTLVQGVGAQQTITKEPVALSIKIKPQINKLTNFVKLDVTSKLGNIQNTNVPSALQNTAFGSVERTAQTTVSVGDTDTIVLGGLMRDNIQESVNKIPLLGDIPILGWLFKSKTTQSMKSNLLIFMTPHILRQPEKVRALLDKKLKQRDEFMESNAGGDDPLKFVRDDIIRSLPDVNELKKQQQRTFTVDEDQPKPAAVPVPAETSLAVPGTPPAAPPAAPQTPPIIEPTAIPQALPPSGGTPGNPPPASQNNLNPLNPPVVLPESNNNGVPEPLTAPQPPNPSSANPAPLPTGL